MWNQIRNPPPVHRNPQTGQIVIFFKYLKYNKIFLFEYITLIDYLVTIFIMIIHSFVILFKTLWRNNFE